MSISELHNNQGGCPSEEGGLKRAEKIESYRAHHHDKSGTVITIEQPSNNQSHLRKNSIMSGEKVKTSHVWSMIKDNNTHSHNTGMPSAFNLNITNEKKSLNMGGDSAAGSQVAKIKNTLKHIF